MIISHAPNTAVDKATMNWLVKDYVGAELRVFINKIARTGQAAFVGDDVERVTMVQTTPRKSKPGGMGFSN